MNSVETQSLAVSAALNHFRTPPSVLYCDIAWNLSKSLPLRLQWIFKDNVVFIDRFHCRSHSCAYHFNTDSFHRLKSHKRSGAESINAMFAFLRRHVRYFTGENLMQFLREVAILSIFEQLYGLKAIREILEKNISWISFLQM